MKGYIISVICAGAVAFIVSTLSPEGEGGGLGRNVRFAIGLMLIIVCLSPLTDLVNTIKDLDLDSILPKVENDAVDYEEYLNSTYESAEKENLICGIKVMLSDNFGIDESEADVSVTIEEKNGERELTRIFITLYGRAIWKDTGEIEAYLGKIFGCEIITAIG